MTMVPLVRATFETVCVPAVQVCCQGPLTSRGSFPDTLGRLNSRPALQPASGSLRHAREVSIVRPTGRVMGDETVPFIKSQLYDDNVGRRPLAGQAPV
jgi:hypothetical protein